MKVRELKPFFHKRIALLGLGLENLALLRLFLKYKVDCLITICDLRSEKQLGERCREFKKHKNIFWQLGKSFNQNLFSFDLLFRSPGWPLFCPGIREALKKKVRVSSPMNLFFELSSTKNIIGVTGTKGKGTTASLVYHILETGGKSVYLGGNIGVAPLEFVDKLKKSDWVVLELSSFQLEDLKFSPRISIVTNIYREHLAAADPFNPNYHKNFKKYIKSKLNISHYQKKSDFLFLNEKLRSVLSKFKNYWGSGKKIYFSKSDLASRLIGEFNQENIGAAVMVVEILKIEPETVIQSVKTFKGLEHRLEFVLEKNGVKYYDNSFSTTPESTIMDLKSFFQPIVLMVGGADKGADFKRLAKVIRDKVKFVVLLSGEATPRLKKELVKVNYPKKNLKLVFKMREAMSAAEKEAKSGDIILLSAACASFGMFKNYKERGDLFKKYARQ